MHNKIDIKLGFKNYKRFKDFPLIEIKPITMLVGTNSSGKSTFIKALLLLVYNLKTSIDSCGKTPPTPLINNITFFFQTITRLDLGDFETSIHKEFDVYGNPVIPHSNHIEFAIEIENTLIELSFGNSNDDSLTSASPGLTYPVKSLRITDVLKGTSICYDMTSSDVKVYATVAPSCLLGWLVDKNHYLQERINNRNSKIDRREFLQKYGTYERSDYYFNYRPTDSLESQIESNTKVMSKLESANVDKLQADLLCKDVTDDMFYALKTYIYHWYANLHDTLFQYIIPSIKPIYVEAHQASHDIALSLKDKNNFLAQTAAEYYSVLPTVKSGERSLEIQRWICKWLKEFKIGKGFEISLHHGGEILNIDIVVGNDSIPPRLTRMPLGTYGTGSIQLVILLLKIACTLCRMTNEVSPVNGKYIIIAEEPEQNLHPSLQSKLADLFNEVFIMTEGRVNFIVETHSEYLIRRSQVIVAQNNYTEEQLDTENPFKVYYFPEDGVPYDMKYLTSGRFDNKFGNGFFDESANSALTISKLERKKANV